MRWWRMPSLSHQAESSESPPIARDANGGPLSERIDSGKPKVSKIRSKARLVGADEVDRNATQASRYRLCTSVTVSG